MPAASVTNTFVANTTAEAAKVNTNFSDLVSWLNTYAIQKDGSLAFTGQVTGHGSDPTSANHLARKAYVDTVTPVGSMMMYGGTTAPSGWVMCDGSAISRSTYADLFAIIGTAFGAGNGTTTFNVPDLRDRVPTGKGTTYSTLGATGGADSVTLTTTELPAHTHSFSATSGNVSASHTHAVGATETVGHTPTHHVTAGTGGAALGNGGTTQLNVGISSATATQSADHTHSVSGTTGSQGSGAAKSIKNQYQTVNFIIKTNVF